MARFLPHWRRVHQLGDMVDALVLDRYSLIACVQLLPPRLKGPTMRIRFVKHNPEALARQKALYGGAHRDAQLRPFAKPLNKPLLGGAQKKG